MFSMVTSESAVEVLPRVLAEVPSFHVLVPMI